MHDPVKYPVVDNGPVMFEVTFEGEVLAGTALFGHSGKAPVDTIFRGATRRRVLDVATFAITCERTGAGGCPGGCGGGSEPCRERASCGSLGRRARTRGGRSPPPGTVRERSCLAARAPTAPRGEHRDSRFGAMPIYEYACTCGKTFETLIVRSSDKRKVRCPACDGTKLALLASPVAPARPRAKLREPRKLKKVR
jgi:putative FmdB family regulatory protein